MARPFNRAHRPGQRRQLLLPSLDFPQGNENAGFHLAKQITLGIDAFAVPSLKAAGNSTCAPCSAWEVRETSGGIKCSSLLASRMALPCFCRRAEVTGGRCMGHGLKNSPSPQARCLKTPFIITTGAKLAISVTPHRVFAPQHQRVSNTSSCLSRRQQVRQLLFWDKQPVTKPRLKCNVSCETLP